MRFFLLALVAVAYSMPTNAQCALWQNCPADTLNFCDFTANDPLLWNEAYWLDPVHNSPNLYETPTVLSLAVRDSCGGAGFGMRGVLFLDLDADGVRETAIDSDSSYTPGMVPFGNVSGAATMRVFDGRPVLPAQKYRFALRFDTTGDVVTATLAWHTGSSFSTPELPAGTHRMEWYVTQAGATDTCAYAFTVRDCQPPDVVAIQGGISVNILAPLFITIYAEDFLHYAEDNVTPVGQLQYAVRRSGTGTGFPVDALGVPVTSISFTCSDMGTQLVEVWARDAQGNADFAQTYVLVQDNLFNCSVGVPTWLFLQVCIATELGETVEEVNVELNGSTPGFPPISTNWTLTGDCYWYNGAAPTPLNYLVVPKKTDNPLNGVSTFDLVKISRHILGQEALDSPYKMIAADANKSNSITSFDIVELRKLILGIYSALPYNDSWRFVQQNHVFPDPNNPFSAPWPEIVTVGELQASIMERYFVGIKVGDVNGSVLPNTLISNEMDDRQAAASLVWPDVTLRKEEIVDIPIYSVEDFSILGMQLALAFDPARVEVLGCRSDVLDEFNAEHYVVRADGGVRLSWNTPHGRVVTAGTPLVTVRARAKIDGLLREALRHPVGDFTSELYPSDGGRRPVDLLVASSGAAPRLLVAPVQPNPTSAAADLLITLSEAHLVALELWDAAGRLAHRSERSLDAGIHRLEIPAEAFAGPGLYTWRVLDGVETVSGKVVRQ